MGISSPFKIPPRSEEWKRKMKRKVEKIRPGKGFRGG